MEASEEMVSTISSASWPAASIARRTAATSLSTPVEVSLWTTPTALIRRSVSFRNASSTASGSAALRQSPGSVTTSAPKSPAISAHHVENAPVSGMTMASPGRNRLTMVLSQAPWPEDAQQRMVPSVPKTRFRSR